MSRVLCGCVAECQAARLDMSTFTVNKLTCVLQFLASESASCQQRRVHYVTTSCPLRATLPTTVTSYPTVSHHRNDIDIDIVFMNQSAWTIAASRQLAGAARAVGASPSMLSAPRTLQRAGGGAGGGESAWCMLDVWRCLYRPSAAAAT